MLVEAGGCHRGKDVLAVECLDHLSTGERIHASGGQCGAHHRQVGGAHEKRALTRVDIRCLIGVRVQPTVALEEVRDALVSQVGLGLRGVELHVEVEWAAGEP